jgi:hypothetical protein
VAHEYCDVTEELENAMNTSATAPLFDWGNGDCSTPKIPRFDQRV